MSVKKWKVIGLMSGTSLDGIDIVNTLISLKNNCYSFKIINSETIPYSKVWERKLRKAYFSSSKNMLKISEEYGKYLGNEVNKFITINEINDVDFVASHGHTIFHKPNEGITVQIGEGKILSEITGLKVICDFRTQDVKLGGQGAPLVPIGDRLLFSNYKYCLNLGGFANISFEKNNKRIAFDICPVNIVLNTYANKLGYNFDKGGTIASKGTVDVELLKKLNAISFYKSDIPKSLGYEFIEEIILPILEKSKCKIADILATFVEHIVNQIKICVDNNKNSALFITGGGAFNTYLINELKKQLKNKIVIPNNTIINYKEALIFALLGVLRSENRVNCLKSVTGAIKDHSSGKIFIN